MRDGYRRQGLEAINGGSLIHDFVALVVMMAAFVLMFLDMVTMATSLHLLEFFWRVNSGPRYFCLFNTDVDQRLSAVYSWATSGREDRSECHDRRSKICWKWLDSWMTLGF